MKKFILLLFAILLLIISALIILNEFAKKKQLTSESLITPIPTIDYGSSYNRSKTNIKKQVSPTGTIAKPTLQITTSINPKDQQKALITNTSEILKKLNVLPQTELTKLEALQKILPAETADFSLDYSPLLNKYIVSKKTTYSDEKFTQWANKNGISEAAINNTFIFTDKPLNDFKKEAENAFSQNQAEIYENNAKTKENTNSDSVSLNQNQNASGSSQLDKDLNLMVDFLRILFHSADNLNLSPSGSEQNNTPGSSSINTPSSLTEIFNEVGLKVGVPPKILEGVMIIEYPSTFNLSSTEIADYSTPGNTIKGCGPNHCAAVGPMQMTIDIDDQGNPSCPACGSSYCPNAWSSYGNAVNTYGGYTHKSNPCNLKDNIYGSAAKLKKDSGASDPLNWTKDQVYRAAERYYGTCEGIRYNRPPIGYGTYCELLWKWYSENKNTSSSGGNNTGLQSVLDWAAKINSNLELGIAEPKYYNRLINTPQSLGYTATYREGRDTGVSRSGEYWCTNLVIDSYNLAGITGLGLQHQAVVNMRAFWMNAPNYKYVVYLNGNKTQALSQIQPGCAVFFEKNPGVYTGLEHTAIVKSVSIDSSANGYLETYDSNSTIKITKYPIYSAEVKNTPLSETLVGFGCL